METIEITRIHTALEILQYNGIKCSIESGGIHNDYIMFFFLPGSFSIQLKSIEEIKIQDGWIVFGCNNYSCTIWYNPINFHITHY